MNKIMYRLNFKALGFFILKVKKTNDASCNITMNKNKIKNQVGFPIQMKLFYDICFKLLSRCRQLVFMAIFIHNSIKQT